ncbi:MAG TPA: hypothetical protein VFX97_19370 [Pyrinomonadaceae bacterium]|nr:hypothetical protein [Pyrinomonadaceae bacterium]
MTLSRLLLIALVLVALSVLISGQTKPRPDVWGPVRVLIGKWEGTGNGKPGISSMQREYRLVMNDKFIHVQNRSVYEPQPKNPKGEIHEDWGMISFDKSRKQLVLRQFHVESFVVQYVHTSTSADGKTLVFTSESIENIPAGYRARETYKINGPDAFSEVFEIAEPGKDFEVYSEAHFKRKK